MLYRRTEREHGEHRPCISPLALSYSKTGKLKRVLEYVNAETGEVLPGEDFPVLSVGAKMAERETILGALRPEVRAFAQFVLKFANKRRGITPSVGTLCHWYADLNGKRTDNVRRHIKPLLAAKVLMHDNLLGPAFQRTGGAAHDHLSEAEGAAARYLLMRNREFDPINGSGSREAPAALVAAEVARLDNEMEAERVQWFAQELPRLREKLTSTIAQPV